MHCTPSFAAGIYVAWRPKLIVAVLLGGVMYIIQEPTSVAALATPRWYLAWGIAILVALEFPWRIGRALYDARQTDEASMATTLVETVMEAMIFYLALLTILTMTTVFDQMLRASPLSDPARYLNFVFFAGCALVLLTEMVIHWKGGVNGARSFFRRVGRLWKAAKQRDPAELANDSQS